MQVNSKTAPVSKEAALRASGADLLFGKFFLARCISFDLRDLVSLDTRTSSNWDLASDDDVFLESVQVIGAT